MTTDHTPKCFLTLAKNDEAWVTRTINGHPFNHQVDLLLPAHAYNQISEALLAGPSLSEPPTYARITTNLSFILDPDLYNGIRAKNVSLLSRGRLDVDNIYTISSGALHLSLDNATFERAGLQGQPAKYFMKNKRRRFFVRLDLRSAPFRLNAKGYTKLQRACENMPDSKSPATTFLVTGLSEDGKQKIKLKDASQHTAAVTVTKLSGVKALDLQPPAGSSVSQGQSSQEKYNHEVWREWAMDTYEYFAMLLMPGAKVADRLRFADQVDPYLCAYTVHDREDSAQSTDIVRVSVSGFLSPAWIQALWKEVTRLYDKLPDSSQQEAWVAFTVHGFENVPAGRGSAERGGLGRSGDGYTFLRIPRDGSTLIYELIGAQEEYP